jgi:ribulose-phosphate 3-epimerase
MTPMELPIIAPSVLSADFGALGEGVRLIEGAGAQWIHMDVMDGHFVPNLTFGPKAVADIKARTALDLDVHLMIEKPELSVDQYLDAGADWLTFHIEACTHAHRLIQRIRQRGRKAGISLVPSTPVSAIAEILGDLDLVLVMSVNPGFGGQSLIPRCLDKIRELDRLRRAQGMDFLISIDGGVNDKTLEAVCDSGVEVMVAGSAFFGHADPATLVREFSTAWKSRRTGQNPAHSTR